MSAHFGIDIGGTKIEGVVVDAAAPAASLVRMRKPTDHSLGYESILAAVSEVVEELRKQSGCSPSAIGIGHPGVVDPRTNRMKNSNTVSLNGRELRNDLQALLKVPLVLANDANCFTLAEARFGAARNAQSVFGVIMGTGVGGGIVVDRRVFGGCQGIAGEWGHNELIPGGPGCYCGRLGCVETVISGPALERYYRERSGRTLPLEMIAERAERASDVHAEETIERLTQYFGKALSMVVNILDPEYIVLGGGVSNIKALYRQGITELSKHVFNDRLGTTVVQNSLGDSAGVFGAAMLTMN